MWKKLGVSLAVLVAIIAGAAWLVLAHLDQNILVSIEQDASAATGTTVTVGSVETSLVSGRAVISNLTVDNPPGFTTPYALALGTITLRASTRTLLRAVLAGADLPGAGLLGTGPLYLDQVAIDGLHIFYEVSGTGKGFSLSSLNLGSDSNLAALQRGATKISTAQGDGGPGQREIIRTFDVNGGRISISTSLLKGPHLTEKLPPIHFTGIGAATGGATTGQICDQVLSAITSQAALTGAASLVKAIGGAATGPFGKALGDRLKSLF